MLGIDEAAVERGHQADRNGEDLPREDVGAGVESDSATGSTKQTSHRDKSIVLKALCTYEESVLHIRKKFCAHTAFSCAFMCSMIANVIILL